MRQLKCCTGVHVADPWNCSKHFTPDHREYLRLVASNSACDRAFWRSLISSPTCIFRIFQSIKYPYVHISTFIDSNFQSSLAFQVCPRLPVECPIVSSMRNKYPRGIHDWSEGNTGLFNPIEQSQVPRAVLLVSSDNIHPTAESIKITFLEDKKWKFECGGGDLDKSLRQRGIIFGYVTPNPQYGLVSRTRRIGTACNVCMCACYSLRQLLVSVVL
jgi:hypothetical protein